MASQSTPRLLVELAAHSLQLALVDAGGRLAGFRKCALSADAVAAALAELSPGVPVKRVEALLVPHAGFVLRANPEEAKSVRTVKNLLARAESAAVELPAPLNVIAFDSATGRRVDTVGAAPWVLAAVSSEAVDAAKAQLGELGLAVSHLSLALPVRIGATVAALQDMPESTRVLVWQVGETDAQLVCVSAGGCEAAGTAAVGFTQIYEAVQAGLGLKFRAAASKLFFNDGYDFSETAGPIAERLAALLRPAIASLGCAPTALYVAGLPAGQAWLAKAVTAALELAPLTPDMAAFCAQRGITGPAVNAELPSSALGLVFSASNGDEGEQAWQPGWLDANAPVPVAAPAPVAPAPAPAAAAPAPAPEVKAPVAPKPIVAPKPPAPVPVPVTSSGAAATPAPVAPAAKPAPVKAAPVANPAAPAPAAKPAAKPITPAPVIKPAEPVPVAAVAPAPATIPPTKPAPAPVIAEAPVQETVYAEPAVAPKKQPVALFAAIGALVVLGGIAAIFMSGGGGEESVAAAPAETQVEQRLREEEMARMMAEELKTPRSFRNERYSFEVSDRGFLRKLVGVGNRTIIDEFGWLELQGTFTGTSKPFYAGTISDNDYVPSINKTVRDGRVVFEINGKHPRFTIETTVTCMPTSLKIETVFNPIDMEEARGPISGVYMVKMNRQSLSLGQRAEIAPGSVSYATQSGPVTMKFNGDAWGQAGETGKQRVAVGSNLVVFYFGSGTDPKHNVLTTELTLP